MFYFQTNLDAPRYRILTVDISLPKESRVWSEFIPEDPSAVLSSVQAVAGDKWLVTRTRNVHDEVLILQGLATKEGDVKPKEIDQIAPDFVGDLSFSGRRDQQWSFGSLTGFTTPGIVGRYIFGDDFVVPNGNTNGHAKPQWWTGQERGWKVWRTTKVSGIVPDDFIVNQEWYESKDGTKVPMFIVRHRSVKQNGTAAAIQYGG